MVDSAHKGGIWTELCGQLAADPEMTEIFLAPGVDELSVSPRAVLSMRNRIREIHTGDLRQIDSDESLQCNLQRGSPRYAGAIFFVQKKNDHPGKCPPA
jgi:phosphoenolpyruvate-protein kinase (PTS system EI component)